MTSGALTIDSSLVDALASPAAFGGGVDEVELIETHISWLILAGDHAYKIKKPVVLDFLDFGSLEKRRHYCEEEVRLNRRWAPEIYLDVVAITMVRGRPRFGGRGRPVEYAVRMRRFAQRMRLDKQLERGELDPADMLELAETIAHRHEQAPVAPASDKARLVALTRQFIEDNFTALEGYLDPEEHELLHAFSRRELDGLAATIERRYADGFFRDCHGDLHLANLVRLDSGIAAFDCIEFNADLRSIDVICDIAFLTMDLVARGRSDLAYLFLNRYLECTGDYDGMAMHDLYLVYRCLVRAKVAAIRAEEEAGPDERDSDLREARRYSAIAADFVRQRSPLLVVMSGLSGSGKTRVAGGLMAELPAVRLRSDVERKRLFGLAETARTGAGIEEGIYAPGTSREVYATLHARARTLLESGQRVILDAAYLDVVRRRAALDLARDCGTAAVIVRVEAPVDVLRARLRQRATKPGEASEAGIAVLEHQLETAEPPGADEAAYLVDCDNTTDVDVDALVRRIHELARRQID